MTRMTGPDCVVMCNLINTHTHTHTHSGFVFIAYVCALLQPPCVMVYYIVSAVLLNVFLVSLHGD